MIISVTVLSGEWKLQNVSDTQPTHNDTVVKKKWNNFSSAQARITVERICCSDPYQTATKFDVLID